MCPRSRRQWCVARSDRPPCHCPFKEQACAWSTASVDGALCWLFHGTVEQYVRGCSRSSCEVHVATSCVVGSASLEAAGPLIEDALRRSVRPLRDCGTPRDRTEEQLFFLCPDYLFGFQSLVVVPFRVIQAACCRDVIIFGAPCPLAAS